MGLDISSTFEWIIKDRDLWTCPNNFIAKLCGLAFINFLLFIREIVPISFGKKINLIFYLTLKPSKTNLVKKSDLKKSIFKQTYNLNFK